MTPFFLLWHLIAYFTNPVSVTYDDMHFLNTIPRHEIQLQLPRPPPIYSLPDFQPLPAMEICERNFAAFQRIQCLLYFAQLKQAERCNKCQGCQGFNISWEQPRQTNHQFFEYLSSWWVPLLITLLSRH